MSEASKYALKAAKFLETQKWIRYSEALDKNGENCSPTSPKAVAFCAVGALRAVGTPTKIRNEIVDANQRISRNGRFVSVDNQEYMESSCAYGLIDWNDEVADCKNDVIRRFRRIANELK